MTTEELLQEMRPISLELEYADPREAAPAGSESGAAVEPREEGAGVEETAEQRSKKEQILELYASGTTDIAEIVRRVHARPSYVAQVLQVAGHLEGYFDLYTTTGREQNVYTRYFRNVLAFRNVEAARESVRKIERLYNYFERLGDRAGQHQAMVLALTGKNRARWSGKLEESQVFSEWLARH
ncbi:MAG TPA: hypothetical protein VEY09_02520 [Pyrinomonadaceae bacterium]|nr:hypothetical protein [Pyrinomonadaceae bacterium]